MRYWLLLLCLLLVAAAHAAKSGYAYVGKIGTLPVQLNLRIDGQELSGAYYYESVGKTIELEGTLAKDRAVTLYEFAEDPLRTNSPSEKRSGDRFSGKLSASGREFTGTWVSADGKRKSAFSLQAAATYTFIDRTWGDAEFIGYYPVFLNASPELKKLEYQYRKNIIDSLNEFHNDVKEQPLEKGDFGTYYWLVDYNLAYSSADLVSIQSYSFLCMGGATGLSALLTYNYRLQDGKLTNITLRSLFKPGTDYLTALKGYIHTDLERQEVDWNNNEEIRLETYSILPSGLLFIIEPNNPFPEYVLVPYAAIRDLINPDGPVGRFMQAPAK